MFGGSDIMFSSFVFILMVATLCSVVLTWCLRGNIMFSSFIYIFCGSDFMFSSFVYMFTW
jgi:hypothetical protein